MRMTVGGGNHGGSKVTGVARGLLSSWPATESHRRTTLCGLLLVTLVGAAIQTGCAPGPRLLKPDDSPFHRPRLVEYPSGYTLQPVVRNLTGATAITFDDKGTLIIAEGGDGELVRIYGFRLGGDGGRFDIYPRFRRHLPGPLKVLNPVEYRMYGPVGGLSWYNGRVYVSHRDADRMGRITALHAGRRAHNDRRGVARRATTA